VWRRERVPLQTWIIPLTARSTAGASGWYLGTCWSAQGGCQRVGCVPRLDNHVAAAPHFHRLPPDQHAPSNCERLCASPITRGCPHVPIRTHSGRRPCAFTDSAPMVDGARGAGGNLWLGWESTPRWKPAHTRCRSRHARARTDSAMQSHATRPPKASDSQQRTSEVVFRNTDWLHVRARDRQRRRGGRDQRRPSHRIAATTVETAAAIAAPRQPPSPPPPCASCCCCQLTSARPGCGVPAGCPWA